MSSIKDQVNKFPKNPGVYIFRDKTGKIIYVGKATNLKSRVQSYFRRNNTNLQMNANDANMQMTASRPIEMMIAKVVKIDYQETDTVLEALILESNLIKKYQPKYNVKEKDDKSFSYFVITKEEFPRVLILRKTELCPHSQPLSQRARGVNVGKTFGPYTSKNQMEVALKIIRKIFPFHSRKQKTEKGCLDFQLGRCPGPYAGVISKKDYQKNIRGIRMILEGKKKSLIVKLEKEMQDFAKEHKFEKAAEIRNKIFALRHIQDIALISGRDEAVPRLYDGMRIEAYDISNISGQQAVGSMVVFADEKPNKKEYRKFKIKTVEGANDVAMMREVLSRRFMNPWAQPDLIILDGGKGHLNMAQKLLKDLGFVIPLVAVAKGPTRKNLELRIMNAESDRKIKNILQDKNLLKHITDEAHRFAITYHKKLRRKEFI